MCMLLPCVSECVCVCSEPLRAGHDSPPVLTAAVHSATHLYTRITCVYIHGCYARLLTIPL